MNYFSLREVLRRKFILFFSFTLNYLECASIHHDRHLRDVIKTTKSRVFQTTELFSISLQVTH